MKIQFYSIYNGIWGYLDSKGGVSWTLVKNPLDGLIFADLEGAVYHVEYMLKSAWRDAFNKGSFCIATIIEEL